MSLALLGGALAAGLVGSPHCVGMCGGFASASAGRPVETSAWHVGRLAAYATLGAIAGRAGAVPWAGTPIGAILAGVLLAWFAGRLAGLLPELPIKVPFVARLGAAVARRRGFGGRLAFGAVTALLPCGLLWSALAVSVAAGSAAGGSLAMLTFGVGTVPALAVAAGAVRRLSAARPWTRRVVAAGVLAAGLWSIGARATLSKPVDPTAPPPCHTPSP